uniref:Metalloprotease TIKI homolog n=1 Tax=Heterorhabditis bacteriophora TaxID=37862 RepID=A0A1I7WL95_HETBA
MLYLKTILLLTLVPNSFSECHTSNDRNIFLWSVNNPVTLSQGYLFGTIHVPYTDVWDRVSDRVREAFSFSDTVLFEVDLHNENTLRKLIKCKNLRKKQTVRSYLSSELYERISNFMVQFRNNLLLWAQKEESYGVDAYKRAQEIYDSVAGHWDRKRPEWLLFALYQLCENLIDRSTSPMLDVFLAQKALEEDKKIHAIETAHEQCNPIVSLSQDDIDEQLREDIIIKRNARMAQRLDRLMGEYPRQTVFSAIGTGHFFGNGSIVEHLRNMGYMIERVRDDDVMYV